LVQFLEAGGDTGDKFLLLVESFKSLEALFDDIRMG